MNYKRLIASLLLLVLYGASLLSLQAAQNPQTNACRRNAHAFFKSELGEHAPIVVDLFDGLSAKQQKSYMDIFGTVDVDSLRFSLRHPYLTFAWLKGKMTRKKKRQLEKAEVLKQLLDVGSFENLLRRSFEDGKSKLTKAERRALVFLFERNYWFHVEWKTFSLTLWLLRHVPVVNWLPILNDPPGHSFYQLMENSLGFFWRPEKVGSTREFSPVMTLNHLFKSLPSRKTLANNLEDIIRKIEEEPLPDHIRAQRHLSFQLLKKAFEYSGTSDVKLRGDLKEMTNRSLTIMSRLNTIGGANPQAPDHHNHVAVLLFAAAVVVAAIVTWTMYIRPYASYFGDESLEEMGARVAGQMLIEDPCLQVLQAARKGAVTKGRQEQLDALIELYTEVAESGFVHQSSFSNNVRSDASERAVYVDLLSRASFETSCINAQP